MHKSSILDVDVTNLFCTHSVSEIQNVEKQIDAEIKKKRIELRSIVGDRYKDILTATEAIKSIETVSESIVDDLQNIIVKCNNLLANVGVSVATHQKPKQITSLDDRNILILIRLIVDINEDIYLAIDNEDFCLAAQYFLFALHIHTGLRLMQENKENLKRYRVIGKLKTSLDSFNGKIIKGCLRKLKNVQLSNEETSSLLNALMFLEDYSSFQLLSKFIGIRQEALQSVIDSSFENVRTQVSAMIKCIYTTILLLHDCFFNHKQTNEGLIWQELNAIIDTNSPPTLLKLMSETHKTYLLIPQIIREFRPKCQNAINILTKDETLQQIQIFLDDTMKIVATGLAKHLELVPNIRGLHLVREEAMKIEMPSSWDEICTQLHLQRNFDVWYFCFQPIVTQRAEYLIIRKIDNCTNTLQAELNRVLSDKSKSKEDDLREYIWGANSQGDDHHILSMKTKGFSPAIVRLCEDVDSAFLNILQDIWTYLYGQDYKKEDEFGQSSCYLSGAKKFVDRESLEVHLKQTCTKNVNKLVNNLEIQLKGNNVTNFIICARFLSALSQLCPSLNKCCSCNNNNEEWERIENFLNKSSLLFWDKWIEDCDLRLHNLLKQSYDAMDMRRMLTILCKWDSIEIQEQTDETIFKSQIKLPMKCSMALEGILDTAADMLNALFPHTLPKQVHLKFLERCVRNVLKQYEIATNDANLNQTQALQFLFDVKYVTTLCVPRENMMLVQESQDVCDKLRSFVDPFDLDVFYKHLQHNVRQNALQSQVIYGCLLPSSNQLASLGVLEKSKEHEKEPSIIALSTPCNNNWFMLLPVTAPTMKTINPTLLPTETKVIHPISNEKPKKNQRTGAAALFGAMTTDWFS